MSMAFTICTMVLVAFAAFSSVAVAVEDVEGIAPAPLQSAGSALGVPVAIAAMASFLAWFF